MMTEPNDSEVRRAFRWLIGSRATPVGRQQRKRPRLEPLESRCLLTTISDFSVPTSKSFPAEITTGPNGNLWFTENVSGTIGGKIGEITPTGTFTEFTIPDTNSTSAPYGIVTGSNGDLWFTDSGTNSVGMINPTTSPPRSLNSPLRQPPIPFPTQSRVRMGRTAKSGLLSRGAEKSA